MFFNKSTLFLVFAVSLVTGLVLVATPAIEAVTVTPILSVTDEDDDTNGIQIYGIRAEFVSFVLTVAFEDDQDVSTEVIGFDVSDIELTAADSDDNIVSRGAEATPVESNAAGSVYTTTITVTQDINAVLIRVPAGAANAIGRLVGTQVEDNDPTQPAENIKVDIVRSAAPPLTISDDTPISGKTPFTVTLTSTKAITLKREDIDVNGGSIPHDGLSSDNTRKVWTVTIVPGVGVKEVTVEPAAKGAFIFPKGTFSVGLPIIREGSIRDLDGTVTISEIMFATNGSTSEIQWIEIFNSSQTEAVALDADSGWRLIIENYDDPEWSEAARLGTINFKNDGDVKTIPANQTVLVVSSRSSRNSDSAYFVSTRVFSVYSELATEFGMSNKRDPFLHATKGFHIKLVDGSNKLADEVGNLDGKTKTSDEPAWRLLNGRTEDDDRTSIIRRYRNYNRKTRGYSNRGIVQDGTEREGWIPAAETNFSYIVNKNLQTWYGSSSDYGSPGARAGAALPAELSHFRPERTETGTVLIRWTTESETNNAGFNILRAETRAGIFEVINAQLIPGAGTTGERNAYTWTDTTAKPNGVYYYQIEDVSFAGERQTLATSRLKGIVSAKGKFTAQWAELKSHTHLR